MGFVEHDSSELPFTVREANRQDKVVVTEIVPQDKD
jgi:hypothetical protein